MNWIVPNLWLIAGLPLFAAGISALAPRSARKLTSSLAIGSFAASFLLSCVAFAATLNGEGGEGIWRQTFTFDWLQMGGAWLRLGWVLDPLTAIMLVMVTFVGLLIFIFSVGYMEHDENFARFFCFLALFGAAMLGLVMSNSLLLTFMSWELVGLASYLLIGFWYHKPSAAAAAKKAFITTRIGDIGFFIGLLWLYSETGTLLFYDDGHGCLEATALAGLIAQTTSIGLGLSTAIGLLIFCGAVGKSGQVPLHVWLPDAMEGPTPVSALIHAATMVAAGVFLVARVYPLLDADPSGVAGTSDALTVVTWVGAVTALFAASIAVGQNDIKRILAYSTVSQLGYMMMGLGVGGVAVGMFHLITHAFFKALLFLGAGSVIHGCHEEQDIRRMGGIKEYMPLTFATYSVGMLALAGVPIFFSGFWSKDEILHAAFEWKASHWPFYLGVAGAFLTAFYMTRQMVYVFFGKYRKEAKHAHRTPSQHTPHESPSVMTAPLAILAVGSILLGFFGTPAWPWFQNYLSGEHEAGGAEQLFRPEIVGVMAISIVIVAAGLWLGWRLYGKKGIADPEVPDPLHTLYPAGFDTLTNKFYVDELYEISVFRVNRAWSRFCDWLDRRLWSGAVRWVCWIALGFSWFDRLADEFIVNLGFDQSCRTVRRGGKAFSSLQNGQVQQYLLAIGIALVFFLIVFSWVGGGAAR